MAEAGNPQVSPGIPWKWTGNHLLESNSAEGKALQRIEAMEAGEGWNGLQCLILKLTRLMKQPLTHETTERGYPVVQSPDPSAVVNTEDLPALPAKLQTGFSKYKLVLAALQG